MAGFRRGVFWDGSAWGPAVEAAGFRVRQQGGRVSWEPSFSISNPSGDAVLLLAKESGII